MSITEVYKPDFGSFHETPIVTWRESRGPIRSAPDMYAQYLAWLTQWTSEGMGRDKYKPSAAFWESGGPQICRALQHFNCRALVFEWESDRKVAYRWFTRKPEERPLMLSNDWYAMCDVRAEVRKDGSAHVVVTTPLDEDMSFSFRADTMKLWLPEPKKPEVTAP